MLFHVMSSYYSFLFFLMEDIRTRAGQEFSYTKYIAEKFSLIKDNTENSFLKSLTFVRLGKRRSPSLPFRVNEETQTIQKVIHLLLTPALPDGNSAHPSQSDTCLRTRQTTSRNVCFPPLAIKGRQGDWLIAQDFLKSVIEIPSKVLAEIQWLRLTFQVLPFSASQGLQVPRYLTPQAAQTPRPGEPTWRVEFQEHYWNVHFPGSFFFYIYIYLFVCFLKSMKTSEAPRFLMNRKFSNATTLTGTLFISGLRYLRMRR